MLVLRSYSSYKFQLHRCLLRPLFSRESEGSFEFGNYWREAEDLRAVIEHFSGKNREVTAIIGHSKGM